jgi:aminoglycoside 2'-N-acetyltransferase I
VARFEQQRPSGGGQLPLASQGVRSAAWDHRVMKDGGREPRVRRLRTEDLTAAEIRDIRELLTAAFGPEEEDRFREEDWQHAIGGMHFVLDLEGDIAAHASVIERELHVGDRPLRTGYVEAVATAPEHQGMGLGSCVMREVGSYVAEHFELGALGTGAQGFYERLGWLTWKGPSSVRTITQTIRTPDEDGFILILETRSSPELDPEAPISCEWRPGDVW